MPRQPLNRYRADVVITVELGALDEDDADKRVAELVERIRTKTTRAVSYAGRGLGSAELVTILSGEEATGLSASVV